MPYVLYAANGNTLFKQVKLQLNITESNLRMLWFQQMPQLLVTADKVGITVLQATAIMIYKLR
jgi:hypothetical protein